jgi:hypothetical protein
VWRPTGEESATTLPLRESDIVKSERMPLAQGAAERVNFAAEGDDQLQLVVGGSPVFLWLK